MATRYAVGSGLWSDTSDVWSDTDGGAAGSYVPVNGDAAVISAAVNVQVDVDQSGFADGMVGMQVRGGATPGMVYWKNGTSGTLMFANGGDITGTNDTNNGRILANSDGSWSTDTELSYATKAIIMLNGSANINCTNLDVKMVPDEPTNFSVTPYLSGSKQDFNAATAVDTTDNTIEITSHGLSEGDEIAFYAGASTLPTPLLEGVMYYVRADADTTANLFKVAGTNSDSTIIDITSVGSGTCSIYKGVAASTTNIPVFEDVTSDNWSVGDAVVLANAGPQGYDQQHNVYIDAGGIAAAQITLATATNSAQKPGAKIYISSMNCSILHSATSASQNIVNAGSGCRFGELRATAGNGTSNFYCYGINAGSSHTATTISGCEYGVNVGSGHTITTIIGCNYGINVGSGHTITTIIGCNLGLYLGSGHTATTIIGCNYGLFYGSGNTATTISGCMSGIYYGSGNTITTVSGCDSGIIYSSGNTATTISGCNNGIYAGSGNTATTIIGCNYSIYYGSSHTATTIIGCNYGIRYGSGHTVATISGCNTGINYGSHNWVSNLSNNSTDIDETYIVYASGGTIPTTPTNGSLNQDGEVSMIFSEHHGGVYGAQSIFQSFGYVTKVTAGDGSYPSQRSGGSATLLCIDNLQSNLSGTDGSGYADNKVIAWEPGKVRVWAAASTSKTYTFYVNCEFGMTAASDLKLIAKYHASAVNTEWTTVTSSETPAVAGGTTDWTQSLSVTINPARDGWITFDIELRAYDADYAVYIDPLMVIS